MYRSLHFVDAASPPPMHLLHLHQTSIYQHYFSNEQNTHRCHETKLSNDLCAQLHEQDVACRRGLDGGDLEAEVPVQRLHDPEQEPVPARAPELHQRVALDDGHLHLRARRHRRPPHAAAAAAAAAAARFHGSHLAPRRCLRHSRCPACCAPSSLLLRGS